MLEADITSLARAKWSIKLFYRPRHEGAWGGGKSPWKAQPSPLLHRADLLVRMALVTSFLPRSWREPAGEKVRETFPVRGCFSC